MNAAYCPKCSMCGAPIATGSMAVFCAFGRKCEFVEDDGQWENIEDFRKCFGIERDQMPASDPKENGNV
jgi:hypothetical protein